ncbi:hypothetical protein V2W30_34645 [Streptomyces sp. Q6]|uniref:Uncharacterized protein n=1 Tax=Streptomyces citrinus TaxID=3118173 RepID=A0ACD5AL77_9ACTN
MATKTDMHGRSEVKPEVTPVVNGAHVDLARLFHCGFSFNWDEGFRSLLPLPSGDHQQGISHDRLE